jgi:uncharacterized membrane protein
MRNMKYRDEPTIQPNVVKILKVLYLWLISLFCLWVATKVKLPVMAIFFGASSVIVFLKAVTATFSDRDMF